MSYHRLGKSPRSSSGHRAVGLSVCPTVHLSVCSKSSHPSPRGGNKSCFTWFCVAIKPKRSQRSIPHPLLPQNTSFPLPIRPHSLFPHLFSSLFSLFFKYRKLPCATRIPETNLSLCLFPSLPFIHRSFPSRLSYFFQYVPYRPQIYFDSPLSSSYHFIFTHHPFLHSHPISKMFLLPVQSHLNFNPHTHPFPFLLSTPLELNPPSPEFTSSPTHPHFTPHWHPCEIWRNFFKTKRRWSFRFKPRNDRSTMVHNIKKHRIKSHPIIHCPTSSGVSEVSEQISERCEWMSKWSSTAVWILVYPGP